MTDLLSDLSRLQGRAEGLRTALDEALAGVAARFEASDRSYTVLVALGADGSVDSIRVDEDWQRKLRPDALDRAIMEAYATAAAHQLRAWTIALTESNFEVRADEIRERLQSEPVAPVPPAPDAVRDVSLARPRDPGEIAADVADALDSLGDLQEPPPEPTGTGGAAFGKLTLTVAPAGLVSSTVDPMWAAQKSGEELTSALAAALTAARADLADVIAKGPVGRLNRLLDEALANLALSRG
jgi:hypothetical protein